MDKGGGFCDAPLQRISWVESETDGFGTWMYSTLAINVNRAMKFAHINWASRFTSIINIRNTCRPFHYRKLTTLTSVQVVVQQLSLLIELKNSVPKWMNSMRWEFCMSKVLTLDLHRDWAQSIANWSVDLHTALTLNSYNWNFNPDLRLITSVCVSFAQITNIDYAQKRDELLIF